MRFVHISSCSQKLGFISTLFSLKPICSISPPHSKCSPAYRNGPKEQLKRHPCFCRDYKATTSVGDNDFVSLGVKIKRNQYKVELMWAALSTNYRVGII